VIAHAQASRLASTGSCSCAPRSGVETIRASVTAVARFCPRRSRWHAA
jgi:hypothetical protein